MNKDFIWDEEINQEFSKVVLDNYHCIENIDAATIEFFFTKLSNREGRRIKPTPSSFVWEIRNKYRGAVRQHTTNNG